MFRSAQTLPRFSTVESVCPFLRVWMAVLCAVCCLAVSHGASLVLNWTDNSDNEIGFRIERAEGAAGVFVAVATVGANVTHYVDEGLDSGAAYQYRVCAFNAFGVSSFSNEATGTTEASTGTGSGPVRIVSGPVGGHVAVGEGLVMSVTVEGSVPVTYQWYLNGGAIPGATESTFSIPVAETVGRGVYRVVVSGGGVSVASDSVLVTVERPDLPSAWLANVSARAWCGTGADATYVGFVLQGAGSKQVLIRGIGPRLADFGVGGTMIDPVLALRDQAGVEVASNDNWGLSSDVSGIVVASARVGAFSLLDGSGDAVVLTDLPAGSFTVANADAGGATGIAMVEIYDTEESGGGSRFVNLSSRAFVGHGDRIAVAGFIVAGTGSKRLLVRAVGPTLRAFGLFDVLNDPEIVIYQHKDGVPIDDVVAANDSWTVGDDGATVSLLSSSVYAFPLTTGSNDAALVVDLGPGSYTVHVTGHDAGTGVALVEVYDID